MFWFLVLVKIGGKVSQFRLYMRGRQLLLAKVKNAYDRIGIFDFED